MRPVATLAVFVGLIFVSGLHAQTPSIQREVDATIELQRIKEGHVLGLFTGRSVPILLAPVLEESLKSIGRLLGKQPGRP